MNKQEVFLTIMEGKKVTKKTIKAEQKRIENLPAKPKDKLDLVLEGIQGLSEKVDKLKKDKGD